MTVERGGKSMKVETADKNGGKAMTYMAPKQRLA
jgi:hypothetical protein